MVSIRGKRAVKSWIAAGLSLLLLSADLPAALAQSFDAARTGESGVRTVALTVLSIGNPAPLAATTIDAAVYAPNPAAAPEIQNPEASAVSPAAGKPAAAEDAAAGNITTMPKTRMSASVERAAALETAANPAILPNGETFDGQAARRDAAPAPDRSETAVPATARGATWSRPAGLAAFTAGLLSSAHAFASPAIAHAARAAAAPDHTELYIFGGLAVAAVAIAGAIGIHRWIKLSVRAQRYFARRRWSARTGRLWTSADEKENRALDKEVQESIKKNRKTLSWFGGRNGPADPNKGADEPPSKRFSDVEGQDEAKKELSKLVDFIKNPAPYRALDSDAQILTGALLVGPPGTGKTLIAKATAGEAGVPFFEISGSDFVRKHVGTGAEAMKELFAKARGDGERRSIVFIDEIDAVARKRSDDTTNHEYHNALNQLLVELSDPKNANVTVIAATNLPDELDEALFRGGRLELRVDMGLPDVDARETILKLHASTVKLEEGLDLRQIAVETPGFSGADLESILRIAVMTAGHRKDTAVRAADIRAAIAKIDKYGEEERPTVRFADIEGQQEAKEDLAKIVDYIKHPEPYLALDSESKGLRGALLVGPPGTGKTLAARATAGEADVPYYQMAGSDFVNKFVGVGADTVRKVFKKARGDGKRPSILFIDEIDAVARRRSEGGEGNQEYETTLNQLLAEMSDPKNANVTVIAATNRPEVMDPAILRGGRLELRIPMGLPDVKDREAVLKLYARSMKLDKRIDLGRIARLTAGLAGADLESIMTAAVLAAGRRRDKKVREFDILKAIEQRQFGRERSRVMSPEEKLALAKHEGGHAFVSQMLPDADPVQKASIMSMTLNNGLNALGVVLSGSEHERFMQDKTWMISRMAVALAGRAGEETMGKQFSGVANDLEQVGRISQQMVMKWGMSEVGVVSFDKLEGLSERMKRRIEDAAEDLRNKAMDLARRTIAEHRKEYDAFVAELLERETMTGEEVARWIPSAPKKNLLSAPVEKETTGEAVKDRR